jgi:Fur family peroxide stress response transcriptional regulator
MVSSSQQTLSQRLVDSGLRATPHRELVYRVLLARMDHPTAEELFARSKLELSGISLATVYNCLEALVNCGLVKQVQLDRGPCRYCPNLHEHAHLHDESSGFITDIEIPPQIAAQLRALLPSGYESSTIDLNFHAHPTPQP